METLNKIKIEDINFLGILAVSRKYQMAQAPSETT